MKFNRQKFLFYNSAVGGFIGLAIATYTTIGSIFGDSSTGLNVFKFLPYILIVIFAWAIMLTIVAALTQSKVFYVGTIGAIIMGYMTFVLINDLMCSSKIEDVVCVQVPPTSELMKYFWVVHLVFIFFVMVFVLLYVKRKILDRDEVLKNGIAGTARVLKNVDDHMKMNNVPMLKLTLEIKIQDQAPYIVTDRFVVPLTVLHKVGVGSVVPVKASKNNKKRVELDIFALV